MQWLPSVTLSSQGRLLILQSDMSRVEDTRECFLSLADFADSPHLARRVMASAGVHLGNRPGTPRSAAFRESGSALQDGRRLSRTSSVSKILRGLLGSGQDVSNEALLSVEKKF